MGNPQYALVILGLDVPAVYCRFPGFYHEFPMFVSGYNDCARRGLLVLGPISLQYT